MKGLETRSGHTTELPNLACTLRIHPDRINRILMCGFELGVIFRGAALALEIHLAEHIER